MTGLGTPPVIHEIYRLLEELIEVNKGIRDYLQVLVDLELAENARREERGTQ